MKKITSLLICWFVTLPLLIITIISGSFILPFLKKEFRKKILEEISLEFCRLKAQLDANGYAKILNPFTTEEPTSKLKIYEFRYPNQDNKEWVAAHTNIEAIKVLCFINEVDLIDFDDEDELVELPESEWDTHAVIDPDSEEPTITFTEWMKSNTKPDIIAGTMYYE